MATSGSITSITTTYAGEFAGKYVAAALLSAPTIEKGGVEILPNIKFKQVMQKMAMTDVLSDASCDFTRTDDAITLTERVLEVKDLQVNLELCKLDFHNTWQGIEQGYSSFDVLPKSFEDYLIGYVAEKVAARNEVNFWRGDSSTSGEYDGIVTQVALDAGLPAAQEIAGTTVTAANVIDELGSIVDAIPSTVYGREDLHIYISQNIARAYVRALGGFGSIANNAGANGVDNRGTLWYGMGQDLAFDGVKLFVANGLADNTAVAAQKSNLFFGCSLNSDLQEVKLLDMSDLDGSNNCRVIMRMACGAQYAIVDDIVTYGIVNSAN
jgi:hypothetical protein